MAQYFYQPELELKKIDVFAELELRFELELAKIRWTRTSIKIDFIVLVQIKPPHRRSVLKETKCRLRRNRQAARRQFDSRTKRWTRCVLTKKIWEMKRSSCLRAVLYRYNQSFKISVRISVSNWQNHHRNIGAMQNCGGCALVIESLCITYLTHLNSTKPYWLFKNSLFIDLLNHGVILRANNAV